MWVHAPEGEEIPKSNEEMELDMCYEKLLLDTNGSDAKDLDIAELEGMDEDELLTRIDDMINEDQLLPRGLREGVEEVLWSALLVKRSTQNDFPASTVLKIPLQGLYCLMPRSLLDRIENEMEEVYEALKGDLDEERLPTLDQITKVRNALLKHAFEQPNVERKSSNGEGKRKSSMSFWVDDCDEAPGSG